MQTQEINRAIIAQTLTHGMKDMKKDPKRTLRRLTDLGKEFSKTPLQSYIFSLFQSLLECEDSPYYEMLEQLLTYTDEEALLTFGMNVGYNSLAKARRSGVYHAPWILLPQMHPVKTDIHSLSQTIYRGRSLGIHSYWIDTEIPVCDSLYHLFCAYPDCAFFHTVKKAEFTPAQYRLIAACPNVMTILSAEEPSHFETVVNLRAQGSLYGIFRHYGSDDPVARDLTELVRPALRYRSAFYFLIAREDCHEQKRQDIAARVRCLRMHPHYPVLLSDVYSDLAEIEKMLGTCH